MKYSSVITRLLGVSVTSDYWQCSDCNVGKVVSHITRVASFVESLSYVSVWWDVAALNPS